MKAFAAVLVYMLLTAGVVANPAFDRWAETFTQDWIRAAPGTATRTQYLPPAEQDAIDRQLSLVWSDGLPVERSVRAAYVERARRGLAELERFPASGLTPVQRTSAAHLKWTLQNALRQAEFADQRYVFEQFRGVHVVLLSTLTEAHPFRNRRDVENYLARLERVAPLLDIGLTEARASAERGVVPPRFILTSTLAALDRLLELPVAKNVLVDTLDKGAAKVGGLSADERKAVVASAEKIVSEAVRPAVERIKALLIAQRENATDDAGVWKLPRGGDYYKAALEAFTTTSLTADEIHAIGLREVAAIERQMDQLLRQLGYTDGSVQARYQLLQTSLLPPTTPDPRPAMLEEITGILRDAERRAASLFDIRPKAPVEVRREPAFTEAGAAARYSAPAPDGTRPGIYWLPLVRITPDVIWLGAGTRSVAYHEAVPGHHFQAALEQESTELPRFRQLRAFGFISAFGEGWALYAERIAEEADFTPRSGRDSRRSTMESKQARLNAILFGRAKPAPI